MPTPEAFAPSMTDRRLLWWMFGFLRPVKGLVLLACVYLVVGIGAEVLAVRQTAEAVNRIELVRARPREAASLREWLSGESIDAANLKKAVLVLAAFSLSIAVLTYLREVTNAKLSLQNLFNFRQAVYDQLQRVGLGFHDRISTGELLNRALTDLQKVRVFIQSAVLTTLEIGLMIGGYLILVLSRSPIAAALALVPLPFWIWYTLRFSRRVRPAQLAEVNVGDRNISIITENIAGIHVVRAFATEAQEIAKYNRNTDELFQRVLARLRLYADFTPVIRGVSMASHLSLFLLAGVLIIKGVLRPGDILILGSAMGAILGRLQQVAVVNEQYQMAIVSARRLHEILATPPTVTEAASWKALPLGRGAVRFENVTFGYDPGRPVLRNVSFETSGGRMVAVVGPTAAGKSTLVQLIARLYEPQKGRILIDGVDIREISLDSLRQHVALVFQETYLFSDTAAANIAYGRPDQRSEEIEEVSRLAQAHEFIAALPRGYQTVLGERGATLSGGQRQRLAIARAVCTDPRILILDDATAAVDPETEELIFGGLRDSRQRTVFVIAHRLNTVKRADLVLVLSHGRITQTGTHDELIHVPGYYRDVAAVQLHADHDFAADGEFPSHMRRSQNQRAVAAAEALAKLTKPETGQE